MEVSRSDGGKFDVAAAQHLLETLRVGLSFAFGRWVASVLPVGYDLGNRIVWEAWNFPICDPAKRVGSAWLYKGKALPFSRWREGAPANCGVPRRRRDEARTSIKASWLAKISS